MPTLESRLDLSYRAGSNAAISTSIIKPATESLTTLDEVVRSLNSALKQTALPTVTRTRDQAHNETRIDSSIISGGTSSYISITEDLAIKGITAQAKGLGMWARHSSGYEINITNDPTFSQFYTAWIRDPLLVRHDFDFHAFGNQGFTEIFSGLLPAVPGEWQLNIEFDSSIWQQGTRRL